MLDEDKMVSRVMAQQLSIGYAACRTPQLGEGDGKEGNEAKPLSQDGSRELICQPWEKRLAVAVL